jgi:hypothetical protein
MVCTNCGCNYLKELAKNKVHRTNTPQTEYRYDDNYEERLDSLLTEYGYNYNHEERLDSLLKEPPVHKKKKSSVGSIIFSIIIFIIIIIFLFPRIFGSICPNLRNANRYINGLSGPINTRVFIDSFWHGFWSTHADCILCIAAGDVPARYR